MNVLIDSFGYTFNTGPTEVKLSRRGIKCGVLELSVLTAKSIVRDPHNGQVVVDMHEPYLNIGLPKPKKEMRESFLLETKRSLGQAAMVLGELSAEMPLLDTIGSYTHLPLARAARAIGFNYSPVAFHEVPKRITKQVGANYRRTGACQQGQIMDGLAFVHLPTTEFIEKFTPSIAQEVTNEPVSAVSS